MTDKEKLDAIRAEINRLVEVRGYSKEMANNLLTFMDSLPNEPVNKDLEETAIEICDQVLKGETSIINDYEWVTPSDAVECFKAGTRWQKEQMMSKAVDGICSLDLGELGAVRTTSDFHLNGLHCGDKVKLIIIKQE